MPTITGGFTFRKGEPLDEKLLDVIKAEGIHVPFEVNITVTENADLKLIDPNGDVKEPE